MSPSKIRDTDHLSQCELLQPPQIQAAKWRRGYCATPQQNDKSGEGLQRSSLSENEGTIHPETSSNTSMASVPAPTSLVPSPSTRRRKFITLADESPRRFSEQSDSCTYDSFNNQETDICRDSSDTDTSSSENIIKTIELEYEVASISSREVLFPTDSSSGTEGNVFADRCASPTSQQEECSSQFADIECLPSDDSELTAADYWTCSKCKNRNNNPRFHCCEKCYQIRRSYYPPRPRRRRGRRRLDSGENSITRGTSFKSVVKRRLRKTSSSSFVSETSDKHWSSIESQRNDETTSGMFTVSISKNRLRVDDSSSDESFILQRSNQNSESSSSSRVSNLRLAAKKRKNSEGQMSSAKRIRSDEVEITLTPNENDIETDLTFSQSVIGDSQVSQKDSGFSSAFSSQETKSTSSEQQQHYDDDTVSEELDEKDVYDMSKEKSPALSPSAFDTNAPETKSNLSLRTCSEPIIKPLEYNTSDCSTVSLQRKICSSLGRTPESSNLTSRQSTSSDPDYGLCVTCSNEPKNGVFVHSRLLHLCCCYKCAVKIWNKNQRCPICNCAVKNVLKLFVY